MSKSLDENLLQNDISLCNTIPFKFIGKVKAFESILYLREQIGTFMCPRLCPTCHGRNPSGM